jgi:molybdopterin/thiamine biosynthesis adenylyltransferase
VLAEGGPEGQLRLAAAHVAIVGEGAAAACAAAYLGAAGVGWIACAPALHGTIDPDRPHLELATLADAEARALDAVIVAAATVADAAALVARWSPRARATLWTAAGHAGAAPPCPACAAAAAPTAPTTALGDALLGTIVATEAVKALLSVGTPLAGHVLAYDAETASITRAAAAARPACACGNAARPE